MTDSSFRRTLVAVLTAALVSGAIAQIAFPAFAASTPATSLDPKSQLERELRPGEIHVYEVVVPADKVVIGTVDQRGVDVLVRVVDPSGRTIATIDSPNGTNGPEPWKILSEPAGKWRIEVAPLDPGATGRYEVRIDETITTEEHALRQARLRYRSPRMLRLWSEHRRDRGAIDLFSKEMAGNAPLVEPIEGDTSGDVLVTFLWRSGASASDVWLLGGPLQNSYEAPMLPFEDSDLRFLTLRAPKDLRVPYAFRVGAPADEGASRLELMAFWTSFVLDPWNPRQFAGQSLVELPEAPAQPWLKAREGAPAGRMIHATIKSKVLREDRAVAVHLPAAFDPKRGSYPFVILLDGEWYGQIPGAPIPTPVILDNLIAEGRVPPMLGVFVHGQGTRMRDLRMSPAFCEFLTKELVPWLRSEYQASAKAADATLAGASGGGLEACYCAFHHSDVFGNVLSQSGQFNLTPGDFETSARHTLEEGPMIREIRDAPRRPVRFWMEAGLFEGGSAALFGSSLAVNNRHMRDVLMLKGYDVSYHEFAGGHSVASWRGSLADGLIALAGKPAKK